MCVKAQLLHKKEGLTSGKCKHNLILVCYPDASQKEWLFKLQGSSTIHTSVF